MKISIADGRGALWQWDTGRRLRVGSGVDQIHYKRAKPAGYVYTPTDQMTLQMIQRQIGDLAGLTTDAKEDLVAAINEAARTGGAGSMALRVAGGYIQYSADGGSTRQNLIAVADLKGAKGDKGEPGGKGDTGSQGAKGDTGATGPQGPKGDPGEKGDPGATGPAGPQGPAGVPGKDGAPGKDGVDGKPGAAGTDGITPHIGDNGNWYIGSTDTGKPSRGATGTPGKDGAKGDPGTPGAAGPAGAPGKDGAPGAQGAQGEKGDKGDPGTPGKTPVRGTDYWTAADKQEIVNSVIAALPDGTEVSY